MSAPGNPFTQGSTAAAAWQRGFATGRLGQIVKPPYTTKGPRQAFIDGWKTGKSAMDALVDRSGKEASHADL